MSDKNSDIRELAAAMNRLSDSIHETNALFAAAQRDDPNWKRVPELLAELIRQLRLIASRL